MGRRADAVARRTPSIAHYPEMFQRNCAGHGAL